MKGMDVKVNRRHGDDVFLRGNWLMQECVSVDVKRRLAVMVSDTRNEERGLLVVPELGVLVVMARMWFFHACYSSSSTPKISSNSSSSSSFRTDSS